MDVSKGQQHQRDEGGYGFPVVRRGYHQAAVDEFARSAHAEISELRRQYETLAAHYASLQATRASAPAPAEADFSSLGGRAQEILRIAEEQAHDLTGGAGADADRLTEQTQVELAMLRDHATAELEELRSTELARLEGLRRQAEHDARTRVEAATTEAEQLLQAARLEAAALRSEAESNIRTALEPAQLRAATVVADAERDALALRQSAAEQRDQVLADLKTEADDLRGRIERTVAEATAMHRDSAEHLAAETAEASRVRDEALAEAERIRRAAGEEAAAVVARAQQQAATVDERSRQEFGWRRRQLRQEQELLTRRKQAMLSQLSSLSALAVETAESLPEVPELVLGEESAGHQDPGTTVAADESDSAEVPDPGQNNRSSALSMPRSTS